MNHIMKILLLTLVVMFAGQGQTALGQDGTPTPPPAEKEQATQQLPDRDGELFFEEIGHPPKGGKVPTEQASPGTGLSEEEVIMAMPPDSEVVDLVKILDKKIAEANTALADHLRSTPSEITPAFHQKMVGLHELVIRLKSQQVAHLKKEITNWKNFFDAWYPEGVDTEAPLGYVTIADVLLKSSEDNDSDTANWLALGAGILILFLLCMIPRNRV